MRVSLPIEFRGHGSASAEPAAPVRAPDGRGPDVTGAASPPRVRLGVADRGDLAANPALTPYTSAPELLNAPEVRAALVQLYPPLLRDAGVGGTALVWFFIDETGRVRRYQIKESSGHASLDEAALKVADVMRFSPALNRDEPVSVWVALPIGFRPN